MKHIITTLLLFLLASPAFAGDPTIEGFIQTKILMKQEEVSQLQKAISLLSSESLTEQEKFERIAQPSFQAVEKVLAEQGYTPQSFYTFEYDNSTTLEQWLADHPSQQGLLEQLDAEKEGLLKKFDQLN